MLKAIAEAPGHHDDLRVADGQRDQPQHGRGRRHQDGAQAFAARLHDGLVALQTLAAQVVNVVDEHNGVVDHHPDENQDADPGHDAERRPGKQKEPEHPDDGEDDRRPDRQRVHQRLEQCGHHQVDQRQGQQQVDHHDVLRRIGLLKAIAEAPGIPLGKLILGERLPDFGPCLVGRDIVELGGDADHRKAVFAVDRPRAAPHAEVGQRGQLDLFIAVTQQGQVAQLVECLAVVVLELQAHLYFAVFGAETPQVLAAHGGRDGLGYLLRREAEQPRPFPVDHDVDLAVASGGLGPYVLEAFDLREHQFDLGGILGQHLARLAAQGHPRRFLSTGPAPGEGRRADGNLGYLFQDQLFEILDISLALVGQQNGRGGIVRSVVGVDRLDLETLFVGEKEAFDLVDGLLDVFERIGIVDVKGEAEFAFVAFVGEEILFDQRRRDGHAEEGGHHQRRRGFAVVQQPVEQASVAVDQAVDEGRRGGRHGHLEGGRGQHRRGGQADLRRTDPARS